MHIRDDVFAQSFSWTHHVQCCHWELQAQWPVGKSSLAAAEDIRSFFTMMKSVFSFFNFHLLSDLDLEHCLDLRGVGDDSESNIMQHLRHVLCFRMS